MFSKIRTMSMTSHRSITFINIKEKVIPQEAKYFSEQIERDTVVSGRINPDETLYRPIICRVLSKLTIDLFVLDP